MDTKARVRQDFAARFGRQPAVVARAPGRLEILGNHTDYNEGFALSCAVDRSTCFAAGPAAGTACRLYDSREDAAVQFDIAAIGPAEPGAWQNYILGVIVELQRRGHKIAAFDAVLHSELPMSSGMSSSAALEISAALAIGQLSGIDLSPAEWARVGQASENNYVGANTGLLDQTSSIMGKAGQFVHIDFRDLSVKTCPVPDGAVIVIANSGVKHDLTQDYNERRERCEEAARALGVPFLRDADLADLNKKRAALSETAYRRALHIIGENDRVDRALRALAAGDLEALGALWLESHASSRTNFENSCVELDFLVETGRALPGFYGARLSGGGFGGISIHLVATDQAEDYRKRLATAFTAKYGREPETMTCAIGEGAETYV